MAMVMEKAEVIRVVDEKGNKIRGQAYWLNGLEKVSYFHNILGVGEANFQATSALHYDDRHREDLPEGWRFEVCTEELEVDEDEFYSDYYG